MPHPNLRENLEAEFGRRGVEWLDELPAIERYARRWSLTVETPFDGLSYGYVAPATRADGTACVLKLSIPEPRFEFEAGLDCLRFWDGEGCCRLLEADEDQGTVLLERLQPGTMLSELAASDDDAATLIAADVMRALWRTPPPEPHRLIPLRRWFVNLLTHREQHDGPGRFPASLLDRGVETAEALLASPEDVAVLHGDLHHFNILRAERAPWLAIDPKGLVGERGFELAAFLRNPEMPTVDVAKRRFALLTEALDLDSQRARAWCLAEALLNLAWCHDSPGDEFDRRLAWVEVILRI